MAQGDRGGGQGNQAFEKAMEQAFNKEEEFSDQASNIVVGEFLSELASAIRFRMKLGQAQGDWIEEPERLFTDGLIFATEEAVASQVKLQITVSLDASTSMWINNIMRYAGPAFIALDKIIRKSMADLPEGTVHYAPFVFHEKAFQIPEAFLNQYAGRTDYTDIKVRKGTKRFNTGWPRSPKRENWQEAIEKGQIAPDASWLNYPMSGTETKIAPLFKAIQAWEQVHGDTSAVRLDIVLTDGVLESAEDVEAATAIQEERNGRLHTVMLNFLSLQEWGQYAAPGRCSQYPVTPDDLTNSIRNILTETIGEML